MEVKVDFAELKKKVISSPEKIKNVDDVIAIDVQRSFNIHKSFDREVDPNILISSKNCFNCKFN